MSGFKITFLGGASAIGASSILLEVAGKTLLIDCGVRFKGSPLPDLSFLDGKNLDAILVTHAHSDHTGGLPLASSMFPSAPIYATPPTIDLVNILQKDALKLLGLTDREQDVSYYTEKQVEQMAAAMIPVRSYHGFNLGDIQVTYVPASHILGASMIHLATPMGNTLVTGDYCVSPQATVPGLDRFRLPVDLVITETTYGERSHSDRGAAENRLIATINEVIEAKGRVLIPAFAIGRAQEVLLILKRALRDGRLPEVPVFVDGMVRSVCDVYSRHESYTSASLAREIRQARHPFYNDLITPVRSPEDRRHVLTVSPSIIVASSGMLSGGASAFYAQEIVQTERDALLITGYQDEESPGRMLLSLVQSGAKPSDRQPLKLGGKLVPVSCRCESYSLSAHADRGQIAGFLASIRPKTVVFVHGDQNAKQSLAQTLAIGDLVHGADGLTLTRRYSRRWVAPQGAQGAPEQATTAASTFLTPGQLNTQALESFANRYPEGEWLDLNQIATDWYAHPPRGNEALLLAEALEELNLAWRDDKRRSKIKRTVFLTPDEQAEVSQNPKGKLLEYCMQKQIPLPKYETSSQGGSWTCHVSVEVDGALQSDKIEGAKTQKFAEQLASRKLLQILLDASLSVDRPDDSPTLQVITVSSDEEERFKKDNPKGKVNEWLIKARIAQVHLERLPVEGGVRCRLVWPQDVTQRLALRASLPNSFVFGLAQLPWYFATKAKTAEHAAYNGALEYLAQLGPLNSADEEAGTIISPDKDPRTLLNELRQKGVVADFGYQELPAEGPSHLPVFAHRAWACLKDGQTITGPKVTAGTKKEAQRLAASELVAAVGGSSLV